MGYYNDLVIQIDKKDCDRFEKYLQSDYTQNDRVLDNDCTVKYTGDYAVYIWMNNHQLRVSASNHYFSLEYEMEKAGFGPDEYVAEMWIEDGEYIKCGNMDIEYMIVMDALVYNPGELKYL